MIFISEAESAALISHELAYDAVRDSRKSSDMAQELKAAGLDAQISDAGQRVRSLGIACPMLSVGATPTAYFADEARSVMPPSNCH
ncbi:hypothetical protein PEC302107_22770 [Pectobacterium araliae]|uniref:Uncharacterized protein n=1 Tax=Pectobacterium araliae TaxID=3073862 RepID=A0AAN0KAR0_9GAMM|nr:hypothetical protein PEC302110_21840 [Pectobacterium sp. MAFF 302110]GKW20548.1 hypothetical protein PEC302107_22770 [Pectobacterium carotovorum subsp. carotovorum]